MKTTTRYLVVKVQVEHEEGLTDDDIQDICEEVEITYDGDHGAITKAKVLEVLKDKPG